jgi:hypothetical protein
VTSSSPSHLAPSSSAYFTSFRPGGASSDQWNGTIVLTCHADPGPPVRPLPSALSQAPILRPRLGDGIPTSDPVLSAGQRPPCAISVPLTPVNHGQQWYPLTRPDHRSSALTARWAQPSKLGLTSQPIRTRYPFWALRRFKWVTQREDAEEVTQREDM